MTIRVAFIFCALLVAAGSSNAAIYKYTAPNGRVYYTDEPKGKHYKRLHFKRSNQFIRFNPQAFKRNKKKFSLLIARAASQYQVEEKLLHAIIQTESAYREKVVSSAGAVGLMQLMPATARRYGVHDSRNAEQNIKGGTLYLKDLLKMFNSNLHLAIAAYNAGENAVKKYHNAIPPYPETRNYVKQVLALYHRK